MEGYPVTKNIDSFFVLSVHSDMDGDFDQFEELDDEFLSSVCLDFNEVTGSATKTPGEATQVDGTASKSQKSSLFNQKYTQEKTRSLPKKGLKGNQPNVNHNKDIGSSTNNNLIKVTEEATSEATSGDSTNQPYQSSDVEVPQEFAFPFEPYDIQVGFMQHLYKTLELGKIGIFESPTGTGKSLSLICGALRWLKDFEEKQRKELEELLEAQRKEDEEKQMKAKKAEELDWISAFAKKQEEDEKTKKLKDEQELRQKRESRLKQLGSRTQKNFRQKRKRDVLEEKFDDLFKDAPTGMKDQIKAELDEVGTDQSDLHDDVLVAEYLSDDEKVKDSDSEEEEDDEVDHVTKIYYCSRTHSQLAQFVREVMKSPHGKDTRVVSLGSRQNLCVNETVKKLQNLSLINDRCLELQKSKTAKKTKSEESVQKKKKSGAGCPYYKHEAVMDYRDSVLVEIKDVEQLVVMGKKMRACPYYGTRYAVPTAELVALPYNTLLHKSTRDSCGVKLKDNIVIIDEAHNLVDTISNVHSVEITGHQITCAHSQLSQYLQRFRTRLKAKNLMYIKQIIFVLASSIKCLGGQCGIPADQQKLPKPETKLHTINDFLFASQLDNLNLFKIMHYCEKSQIAKKLHGFVEKYQPPLVKKEEVKEEKPSNWALSNFLKELSKGKEEANADDSSKENTSPEDNAVMMSSPLMHIQGFLSALTNSDMDGRIVINKQDLLSKSSLKFLLLNPSVHFADVVKEARAVIVAGGTMQPLSEFKDQLFFATGVSPERILEYSCGHVIPPDQLLPIALARGSSGQQLDFTYHSRDLPEMVNELGRVVYNVCSAVPGGVVVFFPSYEYEKNVYAQWEQSGHLEKIAAKKKIFREPKKSSQVDSVLNEYSFCIKKHLSNKYSQFSGAVLFCVVGGKMSEGINFSDDLGRCVLMVGLPYPNIRSPELKEKMDYLNANMPKSPDGKQPGQVHYENLCMKAVNQSIGRAIRHKGDYACILLLDHRYLKPGIRSKLPSWISDRLQNMERFGPAFGAIRKFFMAKKLQE